MVSEQKKERVHALVRLIQDYPIVGVVNLENLPAKQFQKMRKTLSKDDVLLYVSRKRLLLRALQESKKKNIEQLQEKVKGMPALLLCKGNPFALYSTLQKNKSEASAKAGQTAPRDIIVKAGPTNFAPGPIISELASVGIKTKVEAGKLAIMADTQVAKEGDVISQKLAETLKRLDIHPMEIGLNLVAVWENGLVFDAKELRIDEQEYAQKFTQAAQWAMNLAMEAVYVCSGTVEMLLQKAFRDAKGLAVEQNILNDLTVGAVLGKAERQALAVKGAAKVL